MVKLTFANKGKIKQILSLLDDTVTFEVTKLANALLYQEESVTKFLSTKQIKTINHSSGVIRQIIAKEASATARSIRNKLKKIPLNGNLEKYQQELLISYNNKIFIKWNGNLQLDQRLLFIEDSLSSSFDYWISIMLKGQERFYIPIKLNRHMRNLLARGYELKRNTLKICRNGNIILIFKKEQPNNFNTESIGIDIGRNKAFVTSRNEIEVDTKDLLNKLKYKKHGSNNKRSAVRQLKQTIDYEIKNSIDWDNIGTVVLEKLDGMKIGNKWGNTNHHWSYRHIQNRIGLLAEELNVSIRRVHPAYTSQMCSECGYKHKDNRRAEKFKCLDCGHEMDADLNAAINIRNKGTNNAHYPENYDRIIVTNPLTLPSTE